MSAFIAEPIEAGALRPRRALALVVVVLLLLAGALRFSGLLAGLPHVHQIDEKAYAMPAAVLDWGRMEPESQLSPTGFPYAIVVLRTVAGWSGALDAWLRELAGAGHKEAYHVLLGRVLVAACGALTVLPILLLGLRLFGALAATCAGLLMAVDFLHVRQSHWATPDVVMVLLVMAGLAAAAHHGTDGRRRWVLLAGLCAGLAAVVKLPGLLVLPGIGLAVLARPADGRGWGSRLLDLVLPVLVAGAAFLIVDPYAVLDSRTFLRDTTYILGHANHRVEGQPIDPVPLIYAKALGYGAGPLVAAAALLGAVGCFRAHERRRLRLILLALFVAYLGTMATKLSVYVRYTMLMVPFVALLAGFGLQLVASRWPIRRPPLSLLVLLLAAWPAAHSVRFDTLLQREDTREQAGAWLTSNLRRREYVLLDAIMNWLPRGVLTPRVREMAMAVRFDDVMSTEAQAGRRPRYLVSEDWVADYWDPTQVLVNKPKGSNIEEEVAAFYRRLDEQFPVAAAFQPAPVEIPFHFEQIYGPYDHLWTLERPGPGVHIHDLGAAADAPAGSPPDEEPR